MKRLIFIFFLLFFLPIHAETTGTLNFSTRNISVVTGLVAYTVNLCNITADCRGHACFTDYDNTGEGTSKGWCNTSLVTHCFHNNSAYATSTNICDTNTTYRTCSSGNWSSVTSCSSGQTCPSSFGMPGNCTTSSSSSSSSSGSSSTSNVTDKTPSIIFTSITADFDITQGTSAVKTVTVKNNGNVTLYNITLSSSLAWTTVMPTKVNQSVKNNETTFTINFTAPEDAQVKTYVVTLEVNTHNASVKASKSFNLNVKPSNKTVQEEILPEYDTYVSLLSSLEVNLTELERKGADVEEIKTLLLNAKSKISQANTSIESKDYFTAKQLLDDTKSLLDAASNKISTAIIPTPTTVTGDFTFMIIIFGVSGVIIFVIYMLLPPKKQSSTTKTGWPTTQRKKKSILKRLLRR